MSDITPLLVELEQLLATKPFTLLLYAIDRGYFGNGFGLADSAFVSCLRRYALPGFEPVRKTA